LLSQLVRTPIHALPPDADTWRGPYRNLTQGYAESLQTGEDPDMFKTKRGWHMLNHNTGPGSTVLCFSVDGRKWVIPKKSEVPDAFNSTVVFDNGTVIELCQRQRPQVVFAEDGMPGWFWTGVMDGARPCPHDSTAHGNPPTWTLVQAIGRSNESAPVGSA
jgi:hypothetical protein